MDNWTPDVFDVRPIVGAGAGLRSWPVSATPIDEPDGGTFYTEWVDLDDGPEPAGLFSIPGVALEVSDDEASTQDAQSWMQLQNAAHAATCADIPVGEFSATFNADGGGAASAADSAALFHEILAGDILNAGVVARVRWKVTGGLGLKFSLAGGGITKLRG